jgi:hypothetical protein
MPLSRRQYCKPSINVRCTTATRRVGISCIGKKYELLRFTCDVEASEPVCGAVVAMRNAIVSWACKAFVECDTAWSRYCEWVVVGDIVVVTAVERIRAFETVARAAPSCVGYVKLACGVGVSAAWVVLAAGLIVVLWDAAGVVEALLSG